MTLMLDDAARAALWQRVIERIESYAVEVEAERVTPQVTVKDVRPLLAPFDFTHPMDPLAAVDFTAECLRRHQIHTPHPRYFGLFNPSPTTMGIVGDTLAAAFNPQLAVWAHSPFAAEVERHLIRAFGLRFGYDPDQTDGTFASGGSEANHTALLTALTRAFPDLAHVGLRSLPSQPVFYISAEGHHSFRKAARLCGLGTDALREIPVDEQLRMDVAALSSRIQADRRAGFAPFLIVATAGTTNAGVVDPLPPIAALAAEEKLWYHADAAWGGAAALLPELRHTLDGIERADSITFDAHKWLSVPMGAGLYLTRHLDILSRTFEIAAAYVPPRPDGLDVPDAYTHSIQWSRRFIGLKVFLSLAVAGWEGYAETIQHMVTMGERLREELLTAHWQVVNHTPLPIVCFVDREPPSDNSPQDLETIAREVVASGQAWISTTRINGRTALRACITNYRTKNEDVRGLVEALNQARGSMTDHSSA
jgi:glutamate/tyrosine decarboxylase-like PLP-dependent enzyme